MTDKSIPPFLPGTGVSAVSTGSGLISRKPEETFEQWLKKNVREYPVTLDLSDAFSLWITKIVTYWAVAEWFQLRILSRLTKMEIKDFRILLGAPRVGGAPSKITQLIKSKDIEVTVKLEELTAMLNECEKARNLLGHGVWLIDPVTGEMCIENPSGEWRERKQDPISRRKYPQAFHPTFAWFEKTLSDIKSAILALQKLDLEIEAVLSALPQKSE